MKKLIYIILLFVLRILVQAQTTTITPSVFSPPRLSYDAIVALPSPQDGDMVFDTTYKCLRVHISGKWLCNTPSPNDYAPNMLAIASAGGTANDYGQSIAVDKSGNVYITGYFTGTAAFGSVSKTSKGNNDIYLAKYHKSGILQWVESAGGSGEDFGFGIAVDSLGNVYITGNYQGAASFDSVTKTSAGGFDIFVAKYNSSGSIQWAQSAGGASNDYGQAIAIDDNGNSYITGYYYDAITFGTISKTSKGSADIFIAKYNTSGAVQWAQSAGGTSADLANGIALDSIGNVYVTGYYQGTINFNGSFKISSGGTEYLWPNIIL